jgi:DNA-binding Lrp family transcriptional regulator
MQNHAVEVHRIEDSFAKLVATILMLIKVGLSCYNLCQGWFLPSSPPATTPDREGLSNRKEPVTRLDDIDRAILNQLQDNGRRTNAELAMLIGLSPSATLRRVRTLEESGVIERYVTLISREAAGRPTTVFVEISLAGQSEADLDAFEAAVVECPEVMSCHLMAGNADYLVQVACADVEDYERIHRNHLSQLPGVSRIRSSFALRAICGRTGFEL